MKACTLDDVGRKLKTLDAIPTVPAIVQPLTEMLRLPTDRIDIEKVVELVSRDSTIAAHCLRMANSPLFGRRNTETVRSAVLALGLKRVQAILLGCCLNSIVPTDKWAFDAVTFWRHALGCALVSHKMARLIAYQDPEKAYLGGLMHDLGVLVNSLALPEDYRECIRAASDAHIPLQRAEQERFGFTHCQTGKILAEQWHFSGDLVAAIEFHHDVAGATTAASLASLVHLSDLLCRLRDLGYGYYEAMGVELAGDTAWAILAKDHPALANMDLARLTMDIDGAMDEIIALVDAVFKN